MLRELHLPHSRMRQQLLPVLPEQLFPYLRLELYLYRLKIFEPALWRDEGIVRAKEEAVLQSRGRFSQQCFRNVARGPAGKIIEKIGFMLHRCYHLLVPGPGRMSADDGQTRKIGRQSIEVDGTCVIEF